VLDVSPDGTCDVRLEEEGRSMVTVHQDQLETVVPKGAGAAVMVLAGEHKGRKGRLLQASVSGGAAALQLLGDMQLVRCTLDDCAQFMGHLEEEEDY
jgi:G patch domain/KOW motif-containing protein